MDDGACKISVSGLFQKANGERLNGAGRGGVLQVWSVAEGGKRDRLSSPRAAAYPPATWRSARSRPSGGSDRPGQGPDGKNLVRPQAFQIGLRNRDDGDGLSESVEDLDDATRLAIFWMRDEIQKRRHVSPPEVVLGKIALERDTLVEGQAHLFSFEGFKVTNRVCPVACARSQIVITERLLPFGPASRPSARRKTP
jgi:hypothetical protein